VTAKRIAKFSRFPRGRFGPLPYLAQFGFLVLVISVFTTSALALASAQALPSDRSPLEIPESISIQLASYDAASPYPWGHHSGRYDWNHYWTLSTPEIHAPPRPWKWSPFTMILRKFPYAVPYHHMTGMFGGWTYDYRANPSLLINLFPDYVIKRVTTEGRSLHFTAYRKALDASIGETFDWNAGNVKGSVTTTRIGWSGRRYCREFRQDIFIDGLPQQAVGTVCRERGGDWQIAPNQ